MSRGEVRAPRIRLERRHQRRNDARYQLLGVQFDRPIDGLFRLQQRTVRIRGAETVRL